jgi:hypothetical protein
MSALISITPIAKTGPLKAACKTGAQDKLPTTLLRSLRKTFLPVRTRPANP